MNKIYRVVWNKSTQTWTAVSEYATAQGKSSSRSSVAGDTPKSLKGMRFVYTALASVSLLLLGGQAMAAPITGTNSSSGNSNYCVYDDESQTVICGDDTTTSVDTVAGKPAKSVVLGKGATNTGESNIAVGISANSAGTSAVAVGDRAKATAEQAIAVGQNAQANARWDVSVGRQAGWNAAAPTGTNPEGRNIAIGDGALKNGLDVNNNTVMGTSAAANLKGTHNVIIGTYANTVQAIESAEKAGSTETQINAKTRKVAMINGDTGAPTGEEDVKYIETANSVAIGTRALATKAAGVAVGQQAKAFGNTSAAVGNGSRALGDNAVAMGNTANAGAGGAIAIGQQANYQPHVAAKDGNPEIPAAYKTTGANSVAIGVRTNATSNHAIAMGTEAKATANGAVAVGSESNTSGVNATAIGQASEAKGQNSFAAGNDAHAVGTSAVAIGDGAGKGTMTTEEYKAGNYANAASGDSSTAVGVYTKAKGEGSTAIGLSANAQTTRSVAVGAESSVKANQGIAIGDTAQVAEKGLEAKWNASTKAYDLTEIASTAAIAVGKSAVAKGTGSVAVGHKSKTEFMNSTAVGNESKAVGYNSSAFGFEATAKGISSVAIGDKALAGTQDDTTHAPMNNRGVAVGTNTNATGETAVALGSNAESKAHRGTALGVLSKAGVNDSVALGAYSIANRNAGVNGADPLSAKQASADASVWTATHAAVSVGNDAAITDDPRQGATTTAGKFNIPKVTRQITGVAAGSQDTDAVNVAQLKAAGFVLATTADTQAGGTVTTSNTTGTDNKIANGETLTLKAGKGIAINQDGAEVTIATTSDGDKVHYYSVNDGGTQGNNYNNDGATANGALAAGVAASATAENTVAIGKNATAADSNTISIGRQSGSAGVDLANKGANTANDITGRTKAGKTSANGLVNVTSIGNEAGKSTINNNYGVNIGYQAGSGGYNSTYGEGVSIGNKTGGVDKTNATVKTAMQAFSAGQGATDNTIITGNTNTAISSRAGVNALGHDNVAIGKDAGGYSSGNSNIAIGRHAGRASKLNTPNNEATRMIDGDVFSHARNTISMGEWANASGNDAVAIGRLAQAPVEDSIAIGRGVKTELLAGDGVGDREGMIAIGSNTTKATGKAAISIGRNAQGIGRGTVALGDASQANAGQGIAVGAQANVASAAAGGIAIGSLAKSEKHVAIAIGSEAEAKGDKSVAVGSKAIVNSAKGVAVGYGAKAEGAETANIAIGDSAYTNASGALAIGIGASAKGLDVFTTNQQGVATTDKAKPYNAIAIGKGANVDTLAAGANGVQERSTDAIAIGTDAKANYASTIAIGYGAKANTKSSATAIGLNSDAQGWKSLAVGVGAVAKQTDSVALGSDSVADTGINQIGADPLNAQTDKNGHAWKSTKAAVSVGNVTGGVTRQITSVAAGSKDTDAVNVAQLKAAGFVVNTASTANGELGTKTVGTTKNDDDKVQNGETLTIEADKNIKVTQTAAKVTIATKDDVEFTTVTTKDNAGNQTLLNGTGLTITPTGGNNPVSLTSTGLNNGGHNILGVADGNIAAGSTEAVNGGQLFTTNTKVDANTANIAKGLNFAGNTGEFKRELGDKVTISGGLADGKSASNSNIRTVANNGTIDIQIADAPVFTGKVTGHGFDANGEKITNVAKGDAANDAVNVAQLEKAINDAKVQSLTTVNTNSPFSYIGNGKLLKREIDPQTGAVKFYEVDSGAEYTGNDITITALNPSVAQTATPVKVGNVSAGTDDEDAVNVSQLKNAVQALGGGAAVDGSGNITQPSYTVAGNTFNTVGAAIDKLDKEVAKPLTFVGDNAGEKVERKLGTELKVQGGADQAKLSDNNIGVVGSTTDHSLTIKLAKDVNLGADGSLTAGDSKVNNDGLTITKAGKQPVSLTSNGLNNGGNLISNVASNLPATAYNTAAANNPSNATKAQSKPADLDDKKTNAATVGDVLNAGWNVQTNGNDTDFVKPYDTVNFADGDGTSVSSETDGDKTTFKVNVLTPVVYTDENGNKLYKHTNGSFYTQPNGGGDLVDPPNVIASMHGPTGLTNQPVKLANVAEGVANNDAVNVKQLGAAGIYETNSKGDVVLDNGTPKLKGLNFAGNDGTGNSKLGDTWNVVGGNVATNAGDPRTFTDGTFSGGNIKTAVKDGTVEITMADSPKFGDVTVNADGDGKITGVADGNVAADSKDAVNGGQLHGVKSVADSAIQSVVVKAEGNKVKDLTKTDNALNIKGDDNVKVSNDNGDVKVSLKDVVTIGDTTTGKPIKIDGTTGAVTGLTNKDLSAADFAKAGRAASEEQLKIVDDFAVKYDKDQTGQPNKDSITLADTPTPATVNNDGKMAMTGGTALNNVASAGDYTKPENAYKAVNAGDLNNAVSDVKDAGMNFSANDQSKTANKAIHRKLGETVGIKGGITDNATATSGENVITRTTADGNINIELAKNAKFDSVVAGGTKLDNNGLTFVDNAGKAVAKSPSITKTGIDAGGNKITGVAKGTNGTDAVNVDQLKEQLTATEKTTTAQAGSDKVTVKGTTTGNNTDYVIDLADSTKDSLTKADSALQNVLSDNPNLTATKNGNTVTLGFKDDPTFGKVTAGTGANQVVLGNDGVKVGGNTYISGTGLDANNKAISNVKGNLPETVYNTAGANDPSNATTAQTKPSDTDLNAMKNNAATVGDVLNAGWNVQTNGNATDFVKPYDTVNFANGTGTTVTSETDGNKTTFKVNVNAQSLAETAQLPVVYTKANGDKVYKHADGKFYDKPAGQAGAKEVPATDIIASMQNPAGTTTAPTTLANVKAGIKDTDAVNVSQLKGVATALGGGASVNPDGTFKAPSYALTDGNPSTGGTTAYTNVGDALTGLNTAVNKPLTFAGDSGNNIERKLGSIVNIKGGATGTLSDGNIGVVADGTDTLTVKLAKDINLGDTGSVKTGNTTVNNDGVTIKAPATGGTTDVKLTATGLNNGGNKITGVAKGEADTDAVNVSQLKEVQTTAKAAKTEVEAGDNIAVTSTKGADGQTIYTVATKPNVSFDSVTAGTGVNQVVLGNDGVKVGGNTYISGVGLNANDKKVVNVAKGDVNANSKDAINGSQLHAHGEGVKNIIGGNTTYDPATGTYTNADIGGTGKGNIHDAIASINATANAGWNVQTNAGDKTKVKPSDTVNFVDGKNIKITNDGTNIKVATADDLVVNSVTAGNTVVNNDGVKVGDVQITAGGINAGNQQITNLKSGLNGKTLDNIKADPNAAERSNAATIGDLATVQNNVTNISNNVTHITNNVLGGDYVDNNGKLTPDGKLALKTYDVSGQQGTTDNTIISAIKNMNEGGIKYFHTNDGTNKPAGAKDSNTEDSNAYGAYATAVGFRANAEGENALAFGKGSQALAKNAIAIGTGNIVSGENSGAIGDPSIINGSNSYSVGNNNTVATNSTFVLGNDVSQTVDNSVFLGDKSSSKGVHTTANGGNYTYAGANDANVAGVAGSTAPVGVVSVGTENGQTRQIQNVAAGVVSPSSTDAINGSQLYDTHQVINNMGNQLNQRIGDVEDKANAGVSSAMAMASLPQAYIPGKSMLTGGLATYNGEGAVAVGLSKLSDNGRWVLKMSGSADTKGNAGASIGAGFHF